MPARTGAEFLKGLKGGREIWIEGERVADVASHPALSGAAHAVADVFDLQHKASAVCLMPDPETGEPINVSHMLPHSKADLEKRHQALERIAEYSMGLMGRTPDYMNVTYAGFAARADEWSAGGNEEGGENLVKYQKFLRRNDISLTHTIVHPTINRAHGDVPNAGNTVALHKIETTSHGIVVRGSRVLATLAPFADEIAVYPNPIPLQPGAESHALCFNIPMNTPGLKFLCRDSFSRQGNKFDFPLSSRFDEQDAFCIFDDVEVPRDRIFIDGNLTVYNSVMQRCWWPNIMQQTMIRAQTKLEFAWGLVTRMAEAINSSAAHTHMMMGEIWCFAEFARAAVHSAEQGAFDYGNNAWFPNGPPLDALRAFLPMWFPRVNEIIRLIGAHNHFTAPSAAQFSDPTLRHLLDEYLYGAGSITAEQRARIFRLAWDFAGSALGSRNDQYERFYLGSAGRSLQATQLFANRDRAMRLVDRFLAEEY